jgi:hypothetical protein
VDCFTLQKLLNEDALKRATKEKPAVLLEVDGFFGEKTKSRVIEFQRDNGLEQDGVAGDITLAKLHPNYTKTKLAAAAKHVVGAVAEKAIEVALSFEGLKEESGNRGRLVDEWNKALGVPVGSPWCMSFVQQAFARAALVLGRPNPLKPYRTASCFGLMGKIPDSWRVDRHNGQRGDIAIYDFSHTGIVLENCGDGTYICVEGNTNKAGGREGQYVMRKTRKYNQVATFIRVREA